MGREKQQLIGEWMQSKARVVLTRPMISRSSFAKPCARGLDLHVLDQAGDDRMRLIFGVIVKAAMPPATVEEANKILKPALGTFQGLREFTHPICLFYFTMREDQAFFSWLAEPTVVEGMPKLIHHDSGRLRALDTCWQAIMSRPATMVGAICRAIARTVPYQTSRWSQSRPGWESRPIGAICSLAWPRCRYPTGSGGLAGPGDAAAP